MQSRDSCARCGHTENLHTRSFCYEIDESGAFCDCDSFETEIEATALYTIAKRGFEPCCEGTPREVDQSAPRDRL